jgi:deoxyxylulose-5-phosphate synthase
VADVIRYRGRKQNFADAFETVLGNAYSSEKEDLCIVAVGAMVPEAMRSACILKEEHGLETRVANPHTVKPIDGTTILKAAEEIGRILTVEEHRTGGFGNVVAGVIARGKKFASPVAMDMIGVDDRFGESGEPWELTKAFRVRRIDRRALQGAPAGKHPLAAIAPRPPRGGSGLPMVVSPRRLCHAAAKPCVPMTSRTRPKGSEEP